MESENPIDEVLTGREVNSCDDSLVSVQNAIYITSSSTKTRPAGHSLVSFLQWFCQVSRADSLIAACHF